MNSLMKAIDLILRSLTGRTPVKERVRVGANLKPVSPLHVKKAWKAQGVQMRVEQ